MPSRKLEIVNLFLRSGLDAKVKGVLVMMIERVGGEGEQRLWADEADTLCGISASDWYTMCSGVNCRMH